MSSILEAQLLLRSLGTLPQRAFRDQLWKDLMSSLSLAPNIIFDGSAQTTKLDSKSNIAWAHPTGVSSIAMERTDGQL